MATPTPHQGPRKKHVAKKNKDASATAPEGRKKPRTDRVDTTKPSIGNGGTKRRDTPWNEMYEKLLQYKDEYGHCLVTQPYCNKDGIKLGRWVGTQRKKHKKNSHSPLQREKLEAIGFEFSPREDKFDTFYEKLLQYKEEHGHCMVPRNCCKDGVKLGEWVNTQRRKDRKRNYSLQQREKLEAIGFDFEYSPREDKFDTMCEKLLQYKEEHGHCLVQKKKDPKLCDWVKYIRKRKTEDKLTEDRVARLEKLGFVWGVYRKQRANGSGGLLNKPEKDTTTSEDKWANYTVEEFSDEDVI